MFKMLFLVLSIISIGLAVPQYGGSSHSQVAPAPVQQAPTCWTEQQTMWETQYVDQTTQECKPVTKQVPQRVSKTVSKQVCDNGGSSYGGAQQPQVQAPSNNGYNGGSSSGSQVIPRDKPRLRTGSNADAVNFGR